MKPRKGCDTTRAFEAALAGDELETAYSLRLFITGTTPRCARAIQNIRAICDAQLAGRYQLEVIDVYQNPEQVKTEGIVVTPTLVKRLPLPARRLIGDLSDTERVLSGLGIPRRREQVGRHGG